MLVAAAPGALAAQSIHSVPGPEIRAVPLQGAIRLDGKLDEEIWRTAPPASDFRQAEPSEGQPATQRTEVRFTFDDGALYIGARMFDDRGAAGVTTRLVRRDADVSSDYIQVIVDTYHDHIGRLFFLVNPSGVKNDANGLGGGGDPSWDPVWDVQTSIDSLGWTAEIRIPFSELRYPRTGEEQTWGMQIWRQVERLNELSQWSFWGLTESGGPPRFGHLGGLVIRSAPGRGEVVPYVVGRSAHAPSGDALDPFNDPNSMDGRVGADARVLLTSNLTLNATVNPDFGQVEVDPAVVNLSAFETFFDEKRPFFVEGAGYFSFGGLNCYFCSNVSNLSTFYSRRIGRSPSMTGNTESVGDYADIPENTAILGAAKLTGRTSSGWSIGVLDAVTGRASAAVLDRDDSSRVRVTVEPPANYFVGRVARDFRGGATQIRLLGTSVVRGLGDDPFLRARLNSHSEVLGIGSDWWFRRRDYRLMAQVAASQVTGDTGAIRRLQQQPARYFNRPDREQGSNGVFTDAYDPSLQTMRGLGAYARFSRETGKLLWEVSGNMRTPGFENNDIAALSRVDYIWMSANVLPQWTRPTSWYRSLFFIFGGQQQYNFDGDLTDRQFQAYASIQPLNYWNISTFVIYRTSVLDDRLTRGGPVVRRLPLLIWSGNMSTDGRKRIVLRASAESSCNEEDYCSRFVGATAQLRPAPNVLLSIGPSVSRSETGVQYVQAVADPTAAAFYGNRYVFADVTQKSVSMNTRVNVTFTTNLTFELFMQPFIASGRYSNYNEFAAPRSGTRLVYGRDVGTATVSRAVNARPDTTVIDPDGSGPAASFRVVDPSFVLRSLRGNAVLRWEYRPGSTLFAVWTRSSASSLARGDIRMSDDVTGLLAAPSSNIFLVKVNFRVGI